MGEELCDKNAKNAYIDSRNERILQIKNAVFQGKNIKMAETLCINSGVLSEICNGKRLVGMAIIEPIAEHLPQINLNWLIAGRGSMFFEQNSYSEVDDDTTQYKPDMINEMRKDIRRSHDMIDILMDVIKKQNEENIKSED